MINRLNKSNVSDGLQSHPTNCSVWAEQQVLLLISVHHSTLHPACSRPLPWREVAGGFRIKMRQVWMSVQAANLPLFIPYFIGSLLPVFQATKLLCTNSSVNSIFLPFLLCSKSLNFCLQVAPGRMLYFTCFLTPQPEVMKVCFTDCTVISTVFHWFSLPTAPSNQGVLHRLYFMVLSPHSPK